MPVSGTGIFLLTCYYNFFEPILPMCVEVYREDGSLEICHRTNFETAVYAVLQLVMQMQCNSAFCPYFAIILTLMHDGVQIVDSLKIR